MPLPQAKSAGGRDQPLSSAAQGQSRPLAPLVARPRSPKRASSTGPILLSVGYAACHWCHVMAHESFEDAEVAGLMNRLYVNIKVDREERPDIDQIYMAALSATGEQGGWPLTMFLTPDAQALLGRHLFPEAAALRPAGLHAGAGSDRPRLARQARRARRQRATLKNHVDQALSARASVSRRRPRRRSLPALASGIHSHDRPAARRAARRAEISQRALHANAVAELAETGRRSATATPCSISLRHMLNGGIYDHIGGGLCRYSTDADGWCRISKRCSTTTPSSIRLANWAFAETGERLVSGPN